MHLDFVQVVGHFFQGWRRGQRAMSKFGPIPQGGAIMRAMAAEGTSPELQAAVRASLAVNEHRDVNEFLEHRVTPSVYAFIVQQTGGQQVQNLDHAMGLVNLYIETHRRSPGGRVNAMHGEAQSSNQGAYDNRGTQEAPPAFPTTSVPADEGGFISAAIQQERDRIAAMSNQANAAQMAGRGGGAGGKGQPGAKGPKGPGKPKTPVCNSGPRCPDCGCHHPDVKKCPNDLARSDPRITSESKPGPNSTCGHLVYGKYRCDSTKHWARHYA